MITKKKDVEYTGQPVWDHRFDRAGDQEDKRFSVLGNEYFLNIEVNKLPGDNVRVDIVFENTIPANEKYDDLLASMGRMRDLTVTSKS